MKKEDYLNGIPDELMKVLSKYPTGAADYVIDVLQDVQEEFGSLSKKNMIDVSRYLQIPASKVYGIATFYNQFRLQSPGKYLIQMCTGTACHVKGSNKVLEAILKELNIKEGETTPDGLFSVECVRCVGACSIAPVAVVNGEFFGNMSVEKVVPFLEKFGFKSENLEVAK